MRLQHWTPFPPQPIPRDTGGSDGLSLRAPAPPAPLAAWLPIGRPEGQASRGHPGIRERGPAFREYGGRGRQETGEILAPLLSDRRGGHTAALQHRHLDPLKSPTERAWETGGQQPKHQKGLADWHKDNSVTAPSPGPGGIDPRLRCVLCEAVIRFRQGSEQRFHDHMRNDHEVSSSQMGFLLAMHFSDFRERTVWRDLMKPRIDQFKDGATREHTNNPALEAQSPPLSSSPAPTTPSNPPPAQVSAPPPASSCPPIAAMGGTHPGHRGDGRQTTGERLLELGRLANHLSRRVFHGQGRSEGPV